MALVSHRSAPKIASWQSELVDALQKRFGRQWVFHVPVLLNKDRTIGREYTQRSRSFLYAALGFVVARIFGLSSIQIFENGIISFNFPLIPHVLGARASRTTHPQALHGFAGLFSAIVGESFIVNNPFLWKTKSQILKMIAQLDCAELIGGTVSCAHVRDMTVLHPHCGVCSQCIDRRFAVLAAGLGVHDPETLYRLDPLVGDLPRGVARTMAEAYVRSASDIDRMNDLAFFSRFGEAGRAVRFLSDNANEAGRKIYELHKRHANEVCAVVDNAIRSNASALRSHSLPASCLEPDTLNELGQLVVAIEPAPTFLRRIDQLEHHGERRLIREAALRPDRAVPHGGEGALDRVRGPQVFPVFGRKIIECEQGLAILCQALGGLIVFQFVGCDEGVERGLGVLARLGHPDLLQCSLGFRLLALRQFVEDVGGLVHPAALLACGRPQLAERLPEAKRAVGDGQFGRYRRDLGSSNRAAVHGNPARSRARRR